MSEATFTIRLDAALKNAFADAAKAHDRTGAQLVRDFMREYVADQGAARQHDQWFRHQVQSGLDSATSGALIADDEVEAEAQAWREKTRQRMAGNE